LKPHQNTSEPIIIQKKHIQPQSTHHKPNKYQSEHRQDQLEPIIIHTEYVLEL